MLGCLKAEKWISSFQTQELIFRKEICLFSHLPLHNKKRIFYVSKHWHMYYTLLLIPTPLLFPTHLVQLSTNIVSYGGSLLVQGVLQEARIPKSKSRTSKKASEVQIHHQSQHASAAGTTLSSLFLEVAHTLGFNLQ